MLSDNVGEEFLDDEIRVLAIYRIIFECTVFSDLVAGFRRGNDARIHEKADRYWQFATVNQVVEHDRYTSMTVLADKSAAILKHH